MIERFEVPETRETFAYEGRTITVWKTIAVQGRSHRRFHIKIDEAESSMSFSSREAAIGHAKCLIERDLRRALYEEWMWSLAHPAQPANEDRSSRVREKLKEMTVERGCSEEEAEIARQKLHELNQRST